MTTRRPQAKPNERPPRDAGDEPPPVRRCPHCGAVLRGEDRVVKAGAPACRHCGLRLDEGHVA